MYTGQYFTSNDHCLQYRADDHMLTLQHGGLTVITSPWVIITYQLSVIYSNNMHLKIINSYLFSYRVLYNAFKRTSKRKIKTISKKNNVFSFPQV